MSNISFIIPLYNTKINDLVNCINSITSQNIYDYEIILINDGSTDKCLNDFCNANYSNHNYIKYVYQKNSGSAVARNKGLEIATKKYIMFIDSDDEYKLGFFDELEKVSNRLSDICIFDYSYWRINSEKIDSFQREIDFTTEKQKIFSNIMFSHDQYNDFMFGSIWGKCFLREFINNNNIRFSDKLRKAQDRMFMLNVYYYAESIIYMPIYCYKYRINDESICHKMNYKMIDYYYYLYEEMKDFCKGKKIQSDSMKFLGYGIVSELLPLTVFHIDNNLPYFQRKKQYKEIVEKFEFKDNINFLKLNDFKTKKRKIKFILYKFNCFLAIDFYFKYFQKKERKQSFNIKMKGEKNEKI